MYLNLNAPSNYQLQGFGQNGVRTISTDQLYIQGEYYRVLVAEEDSYVTAVSVLGDDLTAEFVYAGTTIYGLFTEVSVTSGSLTAYIAGPTDIEDVWAYINAYGEANAARIEAADCAKDAIAPLLDKYYAKASLVMVPSLYKTSIVYSERPLTTDGQLAFTRSNDTATRVGPDGLIEKVRTNVLLQSNSFDTTWVNTRSTDTSGQAGYDGTNNAWLLQSTSSPANESYIRQTITVSGSNTFSIYAKAGTADFLGLYINATSGTDPFAYFNLSTGAVGTTSATATASIVSVGSGWYRCSIAYNATISNIDVYVTTANGSFLSTTGDNILIQAAQLEAGDIVTDYIPTTTTAVSVGPVANLPRLNYPINSDGSVGCPSLLLEPQATALNQYSESFNNAYWQKQNVILTNNAVTSPDGTQNAETITITTTNGEHNVFNLSAITITANANFTASGFVKNISGRYFSMATYFGGVGFGPYATFDLTTGTLAQSGAAFGTYVSSSITNYGNGWYRISVTGQGNYTSLIIALDARSAASLAPGFQFSGTNEQYAIWGANLTQSSYATSYIPTLGAAVTRGADSCSKTGISSLIGQTEGTLFADFVMVKSGGSYQSILIGSGSNRVYFYYIKSPDKFGWSVSIGGTGFGDTNTTFTPINNQRYKMALAYKNGSNALYINGSLINSNSDALGTATLSAFYFSYLGSELFNMPINQALLFKTRLSNQELQDLTTL
jgi:hypothetical protein